MLTVHCIVIILDYTLHRKEMRINNLHTDLGTNPNTSLPQDWKQSINMVRGIFHLGLELERTVGATFRALMRACSVRSRPASTS